MNRRTLLLLLVFLVVPAVVCLAVAAAATSAPAERYWTAFSDAFGAAALVVFLVLLFAAFLAGPTRIDMTITRDARVPSAQLRHYTEGRVDFRPASFPLQLLALLAAFLILGIGLLVSQLA